MVQHLQGGDTGIDPEILRQIAERPAKGLRVLQDIYAIEPDGTGRRGLQGRDAPHEGRLASSVGTEQTVHARFDRQADPVQRLHAIGVDVAEFIDFQHAGSPDGSGQRTISGDPCLN